MVGEFWTMCRRIKEVKLARISSRTDRLQEDADLNFIPHIDVSGINRSGRIKRIGENDAFYA